MADGDAVDLLPVAQTSDADVDAAEAGAEPDFSIEAVAEHLRATGVRVAISVSPGGDEGSTATVMLARLLAEDGVKVVLIDLTGIVTVAQFGQGNNVAHRSNSLH